MEENNNNIPIKQESAEIKPKTLLMFTLSEWAIMLLCVLLGVLIGVKLHIDFVTDSVEEQCNEYIYNTYPDLRTPLKLMERGFKAVNPDILLANGTYE